MAIMSEKVSRLKIYAEELENCAKMLRREASCQQHLLDNIQNINKYIDSKIDEYENPEEYYRFRDLETEIIISRNKRKYFDNLKKFSDIKTWHYNIIVCGKWKPKNDDKIKFDSETRKYGDYEKLETAKYIYYKLILEYMNDKKVKQMELQFE